MRYIWRYLCVCFVINFFLTGCGGSSGTKNTFSQSDFQGFWEMVGYGYHEKELYCSRGSLNINATGMVTGGDLLNIGYDNEKFTGGALGIDGKGKVSGDLDIYLPDVLSNYKYRILDGQMTGDKNVIIYAGTFPIPFKGLGLLVRKKGGFSHADIEGEWAFPLEQGFFSVSLDNAGTIKSCTVIFEKGNTASCKGSFSISQDGSVTVKIEADKDGKSSMDLNGQMNDKKDVMILAGKVGSRFEGTATLAIRRNEFHPDMGGTWKIFRISRDETISGELTTDGNGNVLSGSWKEVKGKTGSFVRGSITGTGNGYVSGVLTTSADLTLNIIGGQMAADNGIVTVLDKDSSEQFGFMILVKAQ
jgi:hypothetical protein